MPLPFPGRRYFCLCAWLNASHRPQPQTTNPGSYLLSPKAQSNPKPFKKGAGKLFSSAEVLRVRRPTKIHCTQQSHCLCFIGVVGPGPTLRHNCALGDLSRLNPQEPKAPLYRLLSIYLLAGRSRLQCRPGTGREPGLAGLWNEKIPLWPADSQHSHDGIGRLLLLLFRQGALV